MKRKGAWMSPNHLGVAARPTISIAMECGGGGGGGGDGTASGGTTHLVLA